MLNSLSTIAKVILIVCPNRWGIHEEVYIRYCLVLDIHTNAFWLDDPSEQDVSHIFNHIAHKASKEVILSPCPWCQAKEVTTS